MYNKIIAQDILEFLISLKYFVDYLILKNKNNLIVKRNLC